MQAWSEATRGLKAPLLLLDLDAFEANHDDLVRRAAGTPLRVASKSIRVREILHRARQRSAAGRRPGFRGVMAYSLWEALWLAASGFDDIFVAYPTADRAAIAELGRSAYAGSVTLCIDSTEHVQLTAGAGRLRVAIDVDASLRLGPAHLGVRRSPLRTPAQVLPIVDAAERAGLDVVGLMFYDAQIAGLPDSSPAVRLVKKRSAHDLLARRAALVAAVRERADLEFVNGGGTGSLEVTGADPVITELAAGSGLFGPTLFDGYAAFTPGPALAFALPVVRRPARGIATLFGGGYVASGPPGDDRLPSVLHPKGLSLLRTEAAGEVQTPVRGRATGHLAVGDVVWLRHAKSGEICERFDRIHLVRGAELIDTVPTYRGEGVTFG